MQKRTLILILFAAAFVVPQLSFSQRNLEKGNRLFDMNQYEKAIPFFEKDMTCDDKAVRLEATYRLADCYRLLGDFENAEKIYKKLINKGGGKDAIFQYALALKAAAKYYEAKKEFLNYTRLAPEDPRGYMNAKSCDFAQKMLDAEPLYDVRELKTYNTPNVDIAPVYYKGGVVFASQREGGKKPFVNFDGGTGEVLLDLYYVDFDGTEMSFANQIFFMPKINTDLHEGPATFSADGTQMYFTRTVEGDRINKSDKVVKNTLQVFYSEIVGDTAWSKPESAFSFNSIEYSVFHPSLSKDGKRIFFASDMPNGMGGTDIYVCFLLKNGNWSEPYNLGPEVNTTENEIYPFYDNKGHLYFSSNGHPGMGKLDIFKSSYDSLIGWTDVENMLIPVNSIGDDFGYVESDDDGKGMLVSNRINGTGSDDIYTFTKKQPLAIIVDEGKIKIKNFTAYDGVTYTVKLEGEKSSDDLAENEGYFTFSPTDGQNYILTARKDGFMNNQISFSITTNEDGSKEFVFTPKLEDVELKVFLGSEKPAFDEFSMDSLAVPPSFEEPQKPLVSRLKNKIVAGDAPEEYPLKKLLAFKKNDENENKLAYQGIKAQHFIDDEFVQELFSDKKGFVSFTNVASQKNKIVIGGIPPDAVASEVVEEDSVPTALSESEKAEILAENEQIKKAKESENQATVENNVVPQNEVNEAALGFVADGDKFDGKIEVLSVGEIRKNEQFVIKKDGIVVIQVKTDSAGILSLNDLEKEGKYTIESLNDKKLSLIEFSPLFEKQKENRQFDFAPTVALSTRALLNEEITYDEKEAVSSFDTLPAGKIGDEKVLGQVIFNGKKLIGLEVQIVVNDKPAMVAKTGFGRFFSAYMNPKKKNTLLFVIKNQQYRIDLSEKDFVKRKKFFEVVVSVSDIEMELISDDMAVVNKAEKEAKAKAKEALKKSIPQTTAGFVKAGDKLTGRIVLKNAGAVKANESFVLKKDGEVVGTVPADKNGVVELQNLESDAIYSLESVTDKSAGAFAFNPLAELNKGTSEFNFPVSNLANAEAPDNAIVFDEIKVQEIFLNIPAGAPDEEKILGEVIFNGKKLKGVEVEIIEDGKLKTVAYTGEDKVFATYLNSKKKISAIVNVNGKQYQVELNEKDFKKNKNYSQVSIVIDDSKVKLESDDLGAENAKVAVVDPILLKDGLGLLKQGENLTGKIKVIHKGVVKANQSFVLKKDGEIVQNVKSDANGLVDFNALEGDGLYTIEAINDKSAGVFGFNPQSILTNGVTEFVLPLINENNKEVVITEDVASNRANLGLLDLGTSVGGNVSILSNGKPKANEVFIIKKDGVIVATVKSDSNGVVEIKNLSKSGLYTIESSTDKKTGSFAFNTSEVKDGKLQEFVLPIKSTIVATKLLNEEIPFEDVATESMFKNLSSASQGEEKVLGQVKFNGKKLKGLDVAISVDGKLTAIARTGAMRFFVAHMNPKKQNTLFFTIKDQQYKVLLAEKDFVRRKKYLQVLVSLNDAKVELISDDLFAPNAPANEEISTITDKNTSNDLEIDKTQLNPNTTVPVSIEPNPVVNQDKVNAQTQIKAAEEVVAVAPKDNSFLGKLIMMSNGKIKPNEVFVLKKNGEVVGNVKSDMNGAVELKKLDPNGLYTIESALDKSTGTFGFTPTDLQNSGATEILLPVKSAVVATTLLNEEIPYLDVETEAMFKELPAAVQGEEKVLGQVKFNGKKLKGLDVAISVDGKLTAIARTGAMRFFVAQMNPKKQNTLFFTIKDQQYKVQLAEKDFVRRKRYLQVLVSLNDAKVELISDDLFAPNAPVNEQISTTTDKNNFNDLESNKAQLNTDENVPVSSEQNAVVNQNKVSTQTQNKAAEEAVAIAPKDTGFSGKLTMMSNGKLKPNEVFVLKKNGVVVGNVKSDMNGVVELIKLDPSGLYTIESALDKSTGTFGFTPNDLQNSGATEILLPVKSAVVATTLLNEEISYLDVETEAMFNALPSALQGEEKVLGQVKFNGKKLKGLDVAISVDGKLTAITRTGAMRFFVAHMNPKKQNTLFFTIKDQQYKVQLAEKDFVRRKRYLQVLVSLNDAKVELISDDLFAPSPEEKVNTNIASDGNDFNAVNANKTQMNEKVEDVPATEITETPVETKPDLLKNKSNTNYTINTQPVKEETPQQKDKAVPNVLLEDSPIKENIGMNPTSNVSSSKVVIVSDGKLRANEMFTLKKDGVFVANYTSNAMGVVELKALDTNGVYSLESAADRNTGAIIVKPKAVQNSIKTELVLPTKSTVAASVVKNEEIVYDDLTTDELFKTSTPAAQGDEKVLGQIKFNGKKLKGLEVAISANGKLSQVTRTGRNSFFAVHMNPKKQNTLFFTVKGNQYRVNLLETDFVRRKKYLQVVVSLNDAKVELITDDFFDTPAATPIAGATKDANNFNSVNSNKTTIKDEEEAEDVAISPITSTGITTVNKSNSSEVSNNVASEVNTNTKKIVENKNAVSTTAVSTVNPVVNNSTINESKNNVATEVSTNPVAKDLGLVINDAGVSGKLTVLGENQIRKNELFVLKKDGVEVGKIKSDENGVVNLYNLDKKAIYTLESPTDVTTGSISFNPKELQGTGASQLELPTKSLVRPTTIVDEELVVEDLEVDNMFKKVPVGVQGDEKVLGQVRFNGKKLKGLEVAISVNGKLSVMTKTGNNRFFAAYMNPKKQNTLFFTVKNQQYRINLLENDYVRRRKHLQVIISLRDAKVELISDDLFATTPSNSATAKESNANAVSKTAINNDPNAAVNTAVNNNSAAVSAAKKESVQPKNLQLTGLITNGKIPLFEAEVKIFEEGDFVTKTKTGPDGKYVLPVKENAIYTVTVGKENFQYEQLTFKPEQLLASKGKIEADFNLIYKKPIVVSGQVLENNVPVSMASVDVYRDDVILKRTKTDTLGRYKFELREKEKYTLSVTKEGFFQNNFPIETGAAGDSMKLVNSNVPLAKIVENKSVAIPNIYFEYKHWKLTDKSIVELDRLVVFLNANPNIKVLQIFAHSDDIGSDEYNTVLTQKRASTVVEYLIKKGIPRQKILAFGMGKRELLIKKAKTEEEHAKNRRTEFRVILE